MTTLFKIIRYMPCFFKEVTHFYCPACGGTRAVAALLHFDFKRAVCCNPTVVYVCVIFLWCMIGLAFKRIFHKESKVFQPQLWMLMIGMILFLGFAVLRNIAVYKYGYDYLGDLG